MMNDEKIKEYNSQISDTLNDRIKSLFENKSDILDDKEKFKKDKEAQKELAGAFYDYLQEWQIINYKKNWIF